MYDWQLKRKITYELIEKSGKFNSDVFSIISLQGLRIFILQNRNSKITILINNTSYMKIMC